ncbi:MAG: hypothetical protein V3T23_01785 [Nitrososphaerales archaeon]
MKPIKLSTWKISLPMFPPSEVSDNSTNSEYARCPRRGLYRYGLRRSFSGVSYPIQFGLAYHKYREFIEDEMAERDCGLTDFIHEAAMSEATDGFVQPPVEHRHAHNNLVRLNQSFELARKRVTREKEQGKILVMKSEDSFDLELPFVMCPSCGHTTLSDEGNSLPNFCDCDVKPIRSRHGGRVDQFIRMVALTNGEFVKDFKTTGRMGKKYDLKFEPNSQMQGYVWSKEELSGQPCDGVLVETLYNTKSEGPKIFQTWKSFSVGQQEQWMASLMMEKQMIQLMWSRVEELGYLAFPQRTDACLDFGGCGYREACLSGSAYEIEQYLKNDTIEKEWDFTAPDKE